MLTHRYVQITYVNQIDTTYVHIQANDIPGVYGVATISRLLKIKVFFAKEPYKRDYILQKRPIILRSLIIVTTPYQ